VLDEVSELPGHLPEPSCEQVLEAMENVEQTDNQSEEADDPCDAACEGQVRFSINYTRERNQNLREKKFEEFKKIRGEDSVLYCECCNTTGAAYPGSLRERVFEIHHIIPISQYDGQKITNLDDLAVLCANCHRAIRAFPDDQMPSIDEFRQQL
jgi:5-methylcytosine-specific restriction protein A